MLAGGCVIHRSTGRGGAFARAQEPHATTREGKNGDVDEFVVARNPDENSALPFLVKVPLRGEGVVLKVREVWPRTAKVYCHPSTDWPDEPDVVDRVPVRSCVRRGASIDLVLDRSRENRSQFVFTRARGRDVIFWQSARTAKQARPNVGVPRRRDRDLSWTSWSTVVSGTRGRSGDSRRRRARPLPAGDYAVAVDGDVVCSVERKSLADLATTISTGKLRYLLAGLDDVPRSAVVVEDRYSSLFKLTHVRGAVLAEALAAAQVAYPTVPVIFCETRPLAQEWAYPVPRGHGRPSPRRHIGGGARRPTPTGGTRSSTSSHGQRDPGMGGGQRVRDLRTWADPEVGRRRVRSEGAVMNHRGHALSHRVPPPEASGRLREPAVVLGVIATVT